jgi:nitroreductase
MALLLEAHAQGLAAHAMSGIDASAFREAFAIPGQYDIVSIISIAHHGDGQTLPAALIEREQAPRVRLALDEIAHFGAWRE